MKESDEDNNVAAMLEPTEIETDLARSAWRDRVFAVWFLPFAKQAVLFNGPRGEDYFRECGEFARQHKSAPGSSGDDASLILKSAGALEWFRGIDFPKLPGGQDHKPTSWQIEKAQKYLRSRHNSLLSERLREAEEIRSSGDAARADRLATDARRLFSSFSDSSVPCSKALADTDAILGLAESNPPLFTIPGELGRQLNPRLKPDNLGIILANQKIGKTTDVVSLAVLAARQVPTLFISAGDETKLKIDARIATNLSCRVVSAEYAGTFAMPVPDCWHSANGSCPLSLAGEPRQVKDWKRLIEDGATPHELAEGSCDGSRTISGALYQPCCHCYPRNDGSQEDSQRRRHWKSAVWWRLVDFEQIDRGTLAEAKRQFEMMSFNGGLRIASYRAGTLTVDGIYELLDNLDRTENFVPRVIILDYADLMKQDDGRATDKDHDGMRRIWEGLRGLTSTLQVLLISPTQTNRLGGNVETHTVQTIGRCAKAADNCTWMLTLNQTTQERRAKVMRTSMLFAREGGFDPEHQALCCQWHEIQDGFPFSMPVFCKIKNDYREDRG